MRFLTDFGDSAVLIPLSAVTLIWLLATRPVAAAIWWTVTLIIFGAVMATLKIFFFACPPTNDVNSPSGHSGFSLVIYGGLALIIAAQWRSLWVRGAIMLSAVGLVIAIAISRITLEMHTAPEAAIGLIIGLVALAIFAAGYRNIASDRPRVVPLLIGVAATVVVFHGSRLNSESRLQDVSGMLELQRLFCSR